MKKILLQIVFFLSATIAMAQTDIQFSILKAEADGVSASVTNALDLKLRQVFDRNGAGAADLYNVFAIEPTISVEKIISTKDGVVLDVPIAQGELVLIAKNIIDGAEYYSTSIELEGESLGSKDKAMKSMIKGIKVTDPVYKQFINTARKKIEEYYSTNCAFILQKAKALYNQQRYKEAISYLSAATANIPCYDQAYALQEQILAKLGTKPDTVIVEKVVEKPVVVEKIVEKPVPAEAPAAPKCEITISMNDLEFRILSCKGEPTQRRITIKAEYVNQNVNIANGDISLDVVIDDNGKELPRENKAVIANGSSYEWISMPARVNLKHDFYIVNYDHPIETISYMKLKVRNGYVEIRNLKVDW